jgi:hypothetical protein
MLKRGRLTASLSFLWVGSWNQLESNGEGHVFSKIYSFDIKYAFYLPTIINLFHDIKVLGAVTPGSKSRSSLVISSFLLSLLTFSSFLP